MISRQIAAQRMGMLPTGDVPRAVTRLPSITRRFGLSSILEGHRGCVNTVAWSDRGDTLVSSGDDLTIILRSRAENFKEICRIPTTHTGNVFSAKFIPGTSDANIASCARDGAVKVHDVEYQRCIRTLGQYDFTMHKLVFLPRDLSVILSCGEDGRVRRFDVREPDMTAGSPRNVVVDLSSTNQHHSVELHSIAVHHRGHIVGCAGEGPYVRLYDIRATSPHIPWLYECVARLGGESQVASRSQQKSRVTGIAFGGAHGGLLATSYLGGDVVLFDVEAAPTEVLHLTDPLLVSKPMGLAGRVTHDPSSPPPPYLTPDEVERLRVIHRMRHLTKKMGDAKPAHPLELLLQEEGKEGLCPVLGHLSGHVNVGTIKEVAFSGMDQEYVLSGSDCGSVFIWSVATGKIVNVLQNADQRTVNCMATNPQDCTTLATSGIDTSVKIWTPTRAEEPAEDSAFTEIVKNNERRLQTQPDRLTPQQVYQFLLMMRLRQMQQQQEAAATGSSGWDEED